MFTVPVLTVAMLSVEMRCDDRLCRPTVVVRPIVGQPEEVPVVHLHPLEVPTDVRPWTPKKPPPTKEKQ